MTCTHIAGQFSCQFFTAIHKIKYNQTRTFPTDGEKLRSMRPSIIGCAAGWSSALVVPWCAGAGAAARAGGGGLPRGSGQLPGSCSEGGRRHLGSRPATQGVSSGGPQVKNPKMLSASACWHGVPVAKGSIRSRYYACYYRTWLAHRARD